MSEITGSATPSDKITHRAHTAQGQPDRTRLGGRVCDTVYIRELRAWEGILIYVEKLARGHAAIGSAGGAVVSNYVLVTNQTAGENGE